MKTGPFLLQNFLKSFWGTFGPHHTKTHIQTFKGSKHFTLCILFSFSLTVLIVKAVENLT